MLAQVSDDTVQVVRVDVFEGSSDQRMGVTPNGRWQMVEQVLPEEHVPEAEVVHTCIAHLFGTVRTQQ